MKTKLYKFKNVTYTFNPSHRKWNFMVRKNTLITEVPGGAPVAEKIVAVVAGSWKRSKVIQDGIARQQINKITHHQYN